MDEAACQITGNAYIQDKGGTLRWLGADPEIHVTVQVLELMDDRGRAFFDAKYELGDLCPDQPGNRHARRRDG